MSNEILKKFPRNCPSCGDLLQVKQLQCGQCETEVSGAFELPFLARLTAEEQDFIKKFVLYSGSLKAMAREMNLSYPSVRNYLNDLIEKMKTLDHDDNNES